MLAIAATLGSGSRGRRPEHFVVRSRSAGCRQLPVALHAQLAPEKKRRSMQCIDRLVAAPRWPRLLEEAGERRASWPSLIQQ